MSDDLVKVTVSEGKYTFGQRKDGSCYALRYGEPWREDIFDGLTLAMAHHIEVLEAAFLNLSREYDKRGDRIEELEAKLKTASHNAAAFGHRIVELEARLEKAVKSLEAWLELSGHCSIEEGVCCCGEDMKNQSHPMDCGHMPLDHGAYIAGHLEETTRATLAEIKGEQP